MELYEIREIRKGASALNCKVSQHHAHCPFCASSRARQDFKLSQDAQRIKEQFAFTILYGSEFRLKQLCLVGQSINEQFVLTALISCCS